MPIVAMATMLSALIVMSAMALVRLHILTHRIRSLEEELVVHRAATMYPQGATDPAIGLPRVHNSLEKSRLKRDGLARGSPAPLFSLPTPAGDRQVALADYKGQPLLVVFTDPDCGPCSVLWPRLVEFAGANPDLPVIVIARGDRERILRKFGTPVSNPEVVVQEHWEVSRAYATFQLPSGYHVDKGGMIAAAVAVGPNEIMEMASSIAVRSSLVATD